MNKADLALNPPLPREVLLDLCRRLNHDPNRVNRIVLTGQDIEVYYDHLVIDRPAPIAPTTEEGA